LTEWQRLALRVIWLLSRSSPELLRPCSAPSICSHGTSISRLTPNNFSGAWLLCLSHSALSCLRLFCGLSWPRIHWLDGSASSLLFSFAYSTPLLVSYCYHWPLHLFDHFLLEHTSQSTGHNLYHIYTNRLPLSYLLESPFPCNAKSLRLPPLCFSKTTTTMDMTSFLAFTTLVQYHSLESPPSKQSSLRGSFPPSNRATMPSIYFFIYQYLDKALRAQSQSLLLTRLALNHWNVPLS
jgi:hypothetical protein